MVEYQDIYDADREFGEETGLTLRREDGRLLLSQRFENPSGGAFMDDWFFERDFDTADFVPCEGETAAARWSSESEIYAMHERGEFVPFELTGLDKVLRKLNMTDISAATRYCERGGVLMKDFSGTNAGGTAKATPPERGWELRVTTAPLNTLGGYRYSVIFAQYGGQWLFCRHKDRRTWETPGGHIEAFESPLEAAKRELFEETGATEFDICPAFDYKGTDAETSAAGQVFFADVKTLGEIPPDSEIGEARGFDAPPDDWTYPLMQPGLFGKMGKWLGLDHASDDELWDVYDENKNLTGRAHRRGDPLPDGDFHLVVRAWIMNGKGEFLITRRSLRKKGWAGMWEIPSGSAVAGEDGLTAVIREAAEEAGITLLPENGEMFSAYRRGNSFYDSFLFRQEFDLADVVLQEGETIDAKAAAFHEICAMMYAGEFIGRDVFAEFDALEEILRKDGLKYADCAEFRERCRLTDEKGYALAECQTDRAYWRGAAIWTR